MNQQLIRTLPNKVPNLWHSHTDWLVGIRIMAWHTLQLGSTIPYIKQRTRVLSLLQFRSWHHQLSERSIHSTQASGMDITGNLPRFDFDEGKSELSVITTSQHFLAKWQTQPTWYNHTLSLLPLLPPFIDSISFPKHDGCVDKKCKLSECQGLDSCHGSRTILVLDDAKVVAPILATVCSCKRMSHGNSHSHVPSCFKKKTLKNFQWFIREVWNEIQWDSFCQFSSRCPDAKGLWTSNDLRKALGVNSNSNFAPGMILVAKMPSGRKDILLAHSSTFGCWAPIQEILCATARLTLY